MINYIVKQLCRLPQPHRFIAFCVAVFLLVGAIVLLFGQVRSCGYNKGHAKFETESKTWANEKALLQGQIAERDRQIEQLKAKEAAIIAADQAGKKLDDEIANQIDSVIQAANAEADATDRDTDCWTRGDRSCAKLAGLKPPIQIDCDAYKRKLCSTQ